MIEEVSGLYKAFDSNSEMIEGSIVPDPALTRSSKAMEGSIVQTRCFDSNSEMIEGSIVLRISFDLKLRSDGGVNCGN